MLERKIKEKIAAGLRNASGNCLEDENCRYGFGDSCSAPDDFIARKKREIRDAYQHSEDRWFVSEVIADEDSDLINWPCSAYSLFRFVEPK